MKRTLLIPMLALATACSPPSSPTRTVLRVANWVPLDHPLLTEVIRPWADEVARVTQGRVTLQIVEAPLGPPPAQYDLAATGVVDVAYGVHNYTPGRFTTTLLATPGTSEACSAALAAVAMDPAMARVARGMPCRP